MKNIIRFAAISLVLAGAFGVNTASHAKTTNVAVKGAIPVPTCPPGVQDGCGIGNY